MCLSLNPFTREPCSTSETSYCFHREMSYAAQSNIKASKKSEPILHWESPHSALHGCNTMIIVHQGLNVDHSECDDCPSDDENDMPALAPCYFSDSDSSTGLQYDKFGEDPWGGSEFTTYRCNSVNVSHTPPPLNALKIPTRL
jgi:hypothetical protein